VKEGKVNGDKSVQPEEVAIVGTYWWPRVCLQDDKTAAFRLWRPLRSHGNALYSSRKHGISWHGDVIFIL
jgi:hypothetical protein